MTSCMCPVVVVVALDRAHRQRAGEHGEEPVATRRPRRRRRRRAARPARAAARPPRPAAATGRGRGTPAAPAPADGGTDEHPDDHLADELPATQPRPHCDDRPHRREEDRRVDEGEGEAVVEPGLARQGEAHLVVLVDLLLVALERSAPRPGRRRRARGRWAPGRAEQHGRGQGDAQRTPREQGHPGDRQRHRDAEQPPGRRPGRHDTRSRQRSGRSSARPTPMSATSTVTSVRCSMTGRAATGSMSTPSARRQQPDHHAGGDEHDRRRQRPPVQQPRQHGREEQGPPEQEVEHLRLHGERTPTSQRWWARSCRPYCPSVSTGELDPFERMPVRPHASRRAPAYAAATEAAADGDLARQPTVAGSCSP